MATSEPEQDAAKGRPVIGAPVVFMCSRCRTIVGDSYDLVSTDKEAGVFLRHACNVMVSSKTLQHVPAGSQAAAGASYESFSCASCSANLGRIYRTTPSSMDAARDCFSFQVDSLKSYLIGSARTASIMQGGDENDELDKPARPAASVVDGTALSQEVEAMKAMFVVFDRRMAGLEERSSERADKDSQLHAAIQDLEENVRDLSDATARSTPTQRTKRKKSPWV